MTVDLDQMLEEDGTETQQAASEIENINELVEEQVVATRQTTVAVENPMILTNSNWVAFCELSTRLNILDLSALVELPIPDSQHIIGETITDRYSHTRVVTVDADVKIPMITDPSRTNIFTTSSAGNVMNGFVVKQQKTIEGENVANAGSYLCYSYVPFSASARKLVALVKDRMVYYVTMGKSSDPIENVDYVPTTRSEDDPLTETDLIHIKSKFTRTKLAEEWRTLGDALRDIWATVHSTLDPNYQRKMLELNRILCYPEA